MATTLKNQAMIETTLHQHSVQMLMRQLEIKFSLSVEAVRAIADRLNKLLLVDLESLFVEIFKFKTMPQFNEYGQPH